MADKKKLIAEYRKLRMTGGTPKNNSRMADLKRALEKAGISLDYLEPKEGNVISNFLSNKLGKTGPIGGTRKVTFTPKANIYNIDDAYTKMSMMKKGGRLKAKKTKGRKRAALRGHRAEQRGG
jgi:hypothetical protein